MFPPLQDLKPYAERGNTTIGLDWIGLDWIGLDWIGLRGDMNALKNVALLFRGKVNS